MLSTGSYGSEDGQFKYPYGIAIDKNDILYVIDAFNYRMQKFSSDLEFLSKWGDQESIGFKLYMPHELAVTKDGNIIMSDRQNHRISVFSPDGVLIKRFGDFGEGNDTAGSQFSEPHGIAVNENGDIFVCDRYNFRIQKFSSDGEFQLLSGKHQEYLTTASISRLELQLQGMDVFMLLTTMGIAFRNTDS